MAGAIKRFEDIQAWQEARALVRLVYEVTAGDRFARDYGLKDQIQRAAISIMANIAEGFERETDREFVQFLVYARGSVGELKSHLYVALDLGYLSEERFQELHEKAVQVAKLLTGFIQYLKTNRLTTG